MKSSAVTIDDPENECVRINAELYSKVQNNNEKSTRIFLDTHLLKIRSLRCEEDFPSEK